VEIVLGFVVVWPKLCTRSFADVRPAFSMDLYWDQFLPLPPWSRDSIFRNIVWLIKFPATIAQDVAVAYRYTSLKGPCYQPGRLLMGLWKMSSALSRSDGSDPLP